MKFQEPKYWCKIAYYELSTRVGEMYNADQIYQEIHIDGFTNPSGNNNNR